MSDLISRQEAIDTAEMLFKDLRKDEVDMMGIGYNHAVSDNIAILKNLPTVEPRWIPVTERLPENEQDVLVTVNDGCTHVEIDYFTGAHFLNYWDEVLAWMPLPDPWKGEDE